MAKIKSKYHINNALLQKLIEKGEKSENYHASRLIFFIKYYYDIMGFPNVFNMQLCLNLNVISFCVLVQKSMKKTEEKVYTNAFRQLCMPL